MERLFILFMAACASALIFSASAADSSLAVTVVPLFESAGIYVDYGAVDPATCELSFRKLGEAKWKRAFPPVNVKVDKQFRGSLVGLPEDSPFEVLATLRNAAGTELGVAFREFRTWTSSPHVGETVVLKSQGLLEINGVHGSPGAWVKYTMEKGAAINGGDLVNSAVLVKDSSFVILDGLRIKGGRQNGIEIKDSESVRVVNCEISGWGRVGKQMFSKDVPLFGAYYTERGDVIYADKGVFINESSGTVVERCYVHDPRGRAQSWFCSHPFGPIGLSVKAKGSTVVRYNDFIGSDAHRWNDGIGGCGNDDVQGGFNRDADIYGNMLAFGNDDGTELDGGQMNVRFFKNKVEGFHCAVSVAPNSKGPSYVFKNLVTNLGDEDSASGAVVKCGGGPIYSHGMTYIFNNTFHPLGDGLFSAGGCGIAGVGFGAVGEERKFFHATSRNNIIETAAPPIFDPMRNPGNDFDHDLLWCDASLDKRTFVKSSADSERYGIIAQASFLDVPSADFRLAPGSRGLGEGVEIPNFTRPGEDGAVDMGAVSEGTAWLPARPLPLSCDKFQIGLKVDLKNAASSAETIVVKAKNDAGWSSSFVIAKNDAFAWLDVCPASGTLKSGETMTFTVRAEPALFKRTGLHKGLFLIRMESGLSIPVTVYAQVRSNKFSKTFTVEDFKRSGNLKSVEDTGAFFGKALSFAMASELKPDKTWIEVEVDIPADGDYYLLARQKAGGSNWGEHDSMFLAVDGGGPRQVNFKGSFEWTWTLLKCGKPESEDHFAVALKAGRHAIRLFPRESMLLDALIVSADSAVSMGRVEE